jgi:hypothetical protein
MRLPWKIEIGKGESYGGELLIQKKAGKWTGWLGYTLSWNYRQFANLNFGEKFPYRYDHRHDIEFTFAYPVRSKIDFSCTWVYASGNAISLPIAEYRAGYFDGGLLGHPDLLYEGRNGFRLRPYHRLDLSLSFKKQKKWGERSWTVSVYNAYNRQNPFYVDFSSAVGTTKRRLYQHSLFPIIPSVIYTFKF